MRLGREPLKVCVEAHLQGLGVTCLLNTARRKRWGCESGEGGVTFWAKTVSKNTGKKKRNPSKKYGDLSRASKAENMRPKDPNQFQKN